MKYGKLYEYKINQLNKKEGETRKMNIALASTAAICTMEIRISLVKGDEIRTNR